MNILTIKDLFSTHTGAGMQCVPINLKYCKDIQNTSQRAFLISYL